jgi:hypothetical protein
MRSLFFVLTRLGYTQVFADWPTYNADRQRWAGRLLYTLDPATVRALKFDEVLTLNTPRRFAVDPTGRSRWHLKHDGDDVQVLMPALTFCFRLDVPDGALIPMETVCPTSA